MKLFFYKFLNLIKILPKGLKKIKINNDNNSVSIILKDYNYLPNYIEFLKKNFFYKYEVLSYLTCVDNLKNLKKSLDSSNRFILNYFLMSYRFNSFLNLKIFLEEYNLSILSLCSFYKNSNWFEREVWDMFGIFFYNHPDLRRILTDYGFVGFPLRKDFPLTGYLEVRFDEKKKNIVYETLEISQEFRNFRFNNPWFKI